MVVDWRLWCLYSTNKVAVHACMTFIEDVAGKEVITIEGIEASENLHPIQEAFVTQMPYNVVFVHLE